MKTKAVSAFLLTNYALLSGLLQGRGSSVIAQWDFNGGTTSASIGQGTLSEIGGIKLTPVDNDSALNTSVYPAQATKNKGAGLHFDVSTADKQNILITWNERVSPTASKYGRLIYSTNGIDFLDFPTSVVMNSVDKFEPKSFDLSGLAGVDNNPNFAFRIVTEFESLLPVAVMPAT